MGAEPDANRRRVEKSKSPSLSLANDAADQRRRKHRERGAAALHGVQECIRREVGQKGVRRAGQAERRAERVFSMLIIREVLRRRVVIVSLRMSGYRRP